MRSPISHRRPLAALLLSCGTLAAPLPALAAEYVVPMDQVRIITFGTPVSTVFVGNPLIADITVVDATRAFLMGKNFGSTNIIALDANGNQIANDRVTVLTRTGDVVTLHRGAAQSTFACVGGRCQSAPVPGDAIEQFEAVTGQVTDRETGIAAAAGGEGAPQ